VIQLGGTDQRTILIKKEGSTEYTEIAKSAAKKLQKTLDGIRKKEAKAASTAASSITPKEGEEEEIIEEDKSLPKAEKIKIRQAKGKRGVRVVIRGWVATVRVQSRKLVFVDLRDGSDDELQCVLTGKLVLSSLDILIAG
jgi:asparaginyl-tRNA synthetase